ncbi:hypothetical protein BD410DRAFT_847218 [Rickenella mellea]|uniref:Uncharacterized protein n=1 Tax=Rickenella mellea TaxID=50990 RepID=A0A4Y7PD39_9AGAM|nr:hypothetical protein BD410DRAFT_847218 [Rickenella mellea]
MSALPTIFAVGRQMTLDFPRYFLNSLSEASYLLLSALNGIGWMVGKVNKNLQN